MSRHVVRYFEVYLAVLAFTLMTAVIGLIASGIGAQAAALATFGGMALIQFAIQWVDRRRQGALRARAVHEIREMLRDRVLNGLAAMEMWATEDGLSFEQRMAQVRASIEEVAEMINGLSEAQLDTWKLTYAASADLIRPADDALEDGDLSTV